MTPAGDPVVPTPYGEHMESNCITPVASDRLTDRILEVLAAGGLPAGLVYEGPAAGCPCCGPSILAPAA